MFFSISISFFPYPLTHSCSLFMYFSLYHSSLLLFVLVFLLILSSFSVVLSSPPLLSSLVMPPRPLALPLSLSDSGSISSASRVVLLSQWPITQSHCLSSGMDRISRICRLTRHTLSHTYTHIQAETPVT